MTIGKHISNLRVVLGNAGFDDDSVLSSDEQLYSLLNKAAAIVFDRYKSKFQKISDYHWKGFPIKLEEVNEDMFSCEDIPDRCKVLESEYPIPSVLVSRNKMLLKVKSGTRFLSEYKPGNEFDPVKKDLGGWKIVNSKLRIYNNKMLLGVELFGIWSDILSLNDVQYCGAIESDCYDLDTEDYPLLEDEKMSLMAYDMVKSELILALKTMPQNTNSPT